MRRLVRSVSCGGLYYEGTEGTKRERSSQRRNEDNGGERRRPSILLPQRALHRASSPRPRRSLREIGLFGARGAKSWRSSRESEVAKRSSCELRSLRFLAISVARDSDQNQQDRNRRSGAGGCADADRSTDAVAWHFRCHRENVVHRNLDDSLRQA